MIKNCLFAVGLLSLALAGGCATGGNGFVPTVTVSPPQSFDFINDMYPTQSVMLTATVTGASNTGVTWSLGPAATCTGTPNPCGTFTSVTPTTVTYVAPAAPIPSVTVTATLVANSLATGTLQVGVIPVSVVVTPASTPTAVTVGENLVQQFTAVAFPDDAPQAFTWSVTCKVQNCGTIASDSANVASYTAPPNAATVAVLAAWNPPTPPNPAPSGQTSVTVVASRLPAATYSFQFSGHDSSNNPVAAAGSFVLASDGTITAGVEDLQAAGATTQYTISSVSYSPASNNNSLGTLTVALNGGPTNQYTAVVTSSGIIRMIESDTLGKGSGVLQESAANTVFNSAAQTFAFGFTGVDSSGNRVGYVGLLPMTPSGTGGTITGALLDVNDNGTPNSYTNVKGSYMALTTIGPWHMTLTPTSGPQLNFDFFVSGGTAQTKTGPNPLTLYAISTDAVATNPAVSGSMVYQVPMTSGYDNAAFAGTSVSALTGMNANVSLTYGTTDGANGGTGGAGGFTGTFDWNNNGTIVSVPPTQQCTSPTVCAFSYTYVASSGNTGRYVFQMLGNPNATTVVPPLSFVLYASGANRGFLLDQSSPAVMTGAMYPQPANQIASYAPSELPGAYAAATIGDRQPGIVPAVENLLLTWTGAGADFTGVQNPGNQTLTGALYTTSDGTITDTFMEAGTGIITLSAPSVATDVIYAIDVTVLPNPALPAVPNPVITDFFTMGTTSGSPSALIFAQQ